MSALAFAGGLVLTPDAAGFHRATVHVLDGRITAVDNAAAGPDETIVDATGQYLLPGLIDSHYHLVSRSEEVLDVPTIAGSMLESVINAEDCIASGVTTVRDCGCRHEGIYTLQSAIAAGAVVGPDFITAGRNPTGESAPRHWRNVFAAGPDGMRAAVRSQVEAGAGWIKVILAHAFDPYDWADVTVFMTDAEIAAAVDEAHRLGVRIGAHCEGWDVAERGVRLGLDSLDHAPLLSDTAVTGMRDRGLTYTPTVWAFSTDAGVDLELLTEKDRVRVEQWRAEHRASVQRAYAAGVPIAAGSDSASAVTGRGVLLNELLALRECGLPTRAVLAAATVRGAAVMDRAGEVGALQPGFHADLLVVADDPFQNLGTLREPIAVWKGGTARYSRAKGILPNPERRLDAAVVARWT
jgi:imidazolonepropionase-like amidohydrolase